MQERRGEEAGHQPLVGGDRGRRQRGPEGLGHVLRGHGHHRREREQELAVGQRMLGRLAQHDRGQEVGRAFPLHEPRTLPIAGRQFHRARDLQVAVDHERDAAGDVGVREGGELGLGIVLGPRAHAGQTLGQRIRERARVSRHPDPGGVDAGAPAVLEDGGDDHVEVSRPVLGGVGAEQDLAVPGTVDLDTGIARIRLRGRHVAEDHSPAAAPQDLARAGVIGGIEREGVRRRARAQEGLDEPIGRPRLRAPGLEDERGLEGQRRHPQRMDARRVGRQHDPEGRREGDEAEGVPVRLPHAPVEDGRVQAAGEPGEDALQLGQHGADLLHVAAHEDVRKAGRRRELVDVGLRRLRLLADGEGLGGEGVGGTAAQGQQLLDGERRERGAHRGLRLLEQVATHEPRVGLAHLGHRLPRPEMGHGGNVDAPVGTAAAQDGQVEKAQ